MTRVAHLVIGPEQHGVVRHGLDVARGCGEQVIRVLDPADLPPLDGFDVLHLPFTDHLLHREPAGAAQVFDRIATAVRRTGAELSVTLHDVPHDDSPLQRLRRELYAHVIGAARGVVVNSRTELALIEGLAAIGGVHSLAVVPLPVEPAEPVEPVEPVERVPDAGARVELAGPTVGVLGFVYPDRGYEDVLAALPTGATLLAMGRPSAGHEDLPGRYAAAGPGRWAMTGYLPEDELTAHLRSVDVPVAPNRRVTASASINSWLGHGRRPLVPDCAYVRELAAERPGALTVYDAGDPGALTRAVAAALDDPSSTWLAPGTAIGPSLDDAAAGYRSHLWACAPPAPLAVGSARTVPGNRWDLLDDRPVPAPTVTVVIPYFDAQSQLDRTLAGLAVQTHPTDRLEIVVADDGSPRRPDVGWAGEVRTRVVHQDDRGFRAAAARNLGASAADGDVLVFLDADTVPEPGFVAALVRLPACCPDAVTVGRRRHAELGDVRPQDLAALPDAGVRELPEPAWLREAYVASNDLLDVDARSYRFVISAVLSLRRELFVELGGFDERFVGYGGEDWELAHRAQVAGAVLAHVPGAVAWHDGPDWAGRPHAGGSKNLETLALAALLPDAASRGSGQWLPYPSVVVSAGRLSAEQLLVVARTAFASGADCGVWVEHVDGPHAGLVLADPRLHLGVPPADVLARASTQVVLDAPADLSDLPQLCVQAQRLGELRTPALRVVAAHAVHRARRWARRDQGADEDAVRHLLSGRQDRSAPRPLGDLDLAQVLARC